MSIRKLWLLVLILIAVISVSINAFILSSLTDRYFTDYREDVYESHYNEILNYLIKEKGIYTIKVKQLDDNYLEKQIIVE